MKKGQSTAEFVFLVGVVAAGLIAMLVYIGRGHQGNLRSQAEQLGAQQYEPGNTTVSNRDTKGVTKTEAMISATVVKHSENPQGEENAAANAAYAGVEEAMSRLYEKMDQIDRIFQTEGMAKAADVAGGGTWMWAPSGQLQTLLDEYYAIQGEINAFYAAAANAKMPPRKKNKSSSGSESMERGRIVTDKHINETLGNL